MSLVLFLQFQCNYIVRMFEKEEERTIAKARTIHFIQNGHPEKIFTESFGKPLSKDNIENLCQKNWGVKHRSLRYFSLEGVEIMEEDLTYVRNGDRIYVSKGEQFDSERNFGEYQLLKQLGQGGFGKVWLARSSITQQLAAIKILKLQKITGTKDIDMIFREVETLKSLSHPNIVKIINCYTLANMQLVVVMEYLAGGELLGLLKEKNRFDEPTARSIFTQIIEAVHHCHQQGIIHRDLKLQNVLLVSKNDLQVKVADFGISGVADTFNPDVDIGTLRYMAPEVLNRKEKSNTAAVDVWACGIMLYCMIFGKLPFAESTPAATTQAIIAGNVVFPSKMPVSKDCKSLILSLLKINPKQRPSMAQIQNNPWIQGNYDFIVEDKVLEEEPTKIQSKQFKRVSQYKQRLPLIPKRLQKQKHQIMEQLRYLRASRGRLLVSESKWKSGQSPRYLQNTKCRLEQQKGVKRKRSFITNTLWK